MSDNLSHLKFLMDLKVVDGKISHLVFHCLSNNAVGTIKSFIARVIQEGDAGNIYEELNTEKRKWSPIKDDRELSEKLVVFTATNTDNEQYFVINKAKALEEVKKLNGGDLKNNLSKTVHGAGDLAQHDISQTVKQIREHAQGLSALPELIQKLCDWDCDRRIEPGKVDSPSTCIIPEQYEQGNGLVVICNIDKYHDGKHEREGAPEDTRALKELFEGHDNEIIELEASDVTKENLELKVKDWNAKIKNEGLKFLVFFLGTHGEQAPMYSSEVAMQSRPSKRKRFSAKSENLGESTKLDYAWDYNKKHIYVDQDIIQPLSEVTVNKSTGVPKLFLIACCRGSARNQTEHEVEAAISSDSNSPGEIPPTVIQLNGSDNLVYYATVNGHVSFRHQSEGTVLIQNFAKNIRKYPKECLSQVLMATNSSISEEEIVEEGKRVHQVPIIHNSLRHRFVIRDINTS